MLSMGSMDKQVRDKWGYASISCGIALILVGVFIFVIAFVTNNIIYETRYSFWDYWAPVAMYLMITGAFLAAVGKEYLVRARSRWGYMGYVWIASGFISIIIDISQLLDWIHRSINVLGFENFSMISESFFSYLMESLFFIIVGLILGLKTRNKLAYITIAGGLAIMLVGISVLLNNLAYHLSTHYYLNLQLSWAPIISYSLIIGSILVVIGTVYLIITPKIESKKTSN